MADVELRRGIEKRARQRAVEVADLEANVARLLEVFGRFLRYQRSEQRLGPLQSATTGSYS
jgi:hypothetical protein